jgi:hypothetical protein
MGLRSPQEMQTVKLKADGSTRFSGAVAPKISTEFIDVLQQEVNEQEAARVANEKKKLEFLTAKASNEAERDVLIPAMSEVTNAEGLSAMEVANKNRDKLQKALFKKLDTIPEQYRPYVQAEFDKKLTRFEKTAIPHVYGQTKKVEDETFKTHIANKVNEAIEGSGDLEEFGTIGLANVEIAIKKRAERLGLSPEQTDAAVQAGVSETVVRSIEQQAMVGRLDLAAESLKRFNEEVTPRDRVKAIKIIESAKKQMGTLEASRLSDEALAQSDGNLALAERYIVSTAPNDRIAKQALGFMNYRHEARRKQEVAQIESLKAKVNRSIKEGSMDMQSFNALPVEEQDKINEYLNKTRGGKLIITDWKAHDELVERLFDTNTAETLRDDIIDSKRHLISPEVMKPLEMRYLRLKQEDNKNYAAGQRGLSLDTLNTLVGQIATENKMSNKAERAKLKNLVIDAQEKILTQNDKITPRELKIQIRKALKDNGIKKVEEPYFFGLFSKEKLKANEDVVDNSPAVHPSAREALKTKYPNLSESQLYEILKRANEKNIDVSKPRKY